MNSSPVQLGSTIWIRFCLVSATHSWPVALSIARPRGQLNLPSSAPSVAREPQIARMWPLRSMRTIR